MLASLREQVAAPREPEPAVRRDEPDAVHQMRVATRRLRGTPRSSGEVIPRAETEQLAGELTWLSEHHDTVIARQAARDLGVAAHLAGENAFSYGLLLELRSPAHLPSPLLWPSVSRILRWAS